MRYGHVPARAIYGVLIALSCGAYLNTLFASFAFDDNFAVVRTSRCLNTRPADHLEYLKHVDL